jgi:two-component system, NtrC family, sensor kinase
MHDDAGAPNGRAPARPGLQWRIVTLLLVVSILPLAIMGIGAWLAYGNLLTEKSLDLQRAVVRNHAKSIDSFLLERLRALDLIVRANTIEQLSREESLQAVFDSVSHAYSQTFVDLGVIASDGSHVAYVGPYALKDKNYAGSPWFHSVMSEGSYVSDVFLGFREVPHCVIAVKGHAGDQVWVLRATINSDKFESLVRSEQLGAGGDAYILNADGVFQMPPKNGKVLDRSASVIPRHHNGVQDQRVSVQGRTMVRVTTWINNDRWMLVVDQSEAEVQKPVHLATMWGAMVVLLAVGLIVLTTFLATWHLTGQIDRANQERDKLSGELLRSAKLASLGEMSTGLAHEINNPLAIMMTEHTNIADVAQELTESDSIRQEILESVRRAKRQVERCGGITAKMLQFGRAGETKLQPTDIRPRVEEIIGLMSKQAQIRNVTIHTEIEPNLPKVVLDPIELQQVMVNLINNAMDAMKDKGDIYVTVRREGRQVRLSIRDNGSGIPAEQLGKVFQPFFTTKPVGKGTGLGLSVCYGIVQKWGGTIEVESEEGVGTEMMIRLAVPGGPK